jgi:O-acetyl-ADP-ribose deacetylase (regulator of RNase III)
MCTVLNLYARFSKPFLDCAGGSSVDRECEEFVRRKGELSPGQVFVSTAGKMKFKKVIHTVGPIWKASGQKYTLAMDLEKAVSAALWEGDKLGYSTLALPAISCGVYGYPMDEAADIILKAILLFLRTSASIEVVYLVSGADTVKKFHSQLSKMTPTERDASAVSGIRLSNYFFIKEAFTYYVGLAT